MPRKDLSLHNVSEKEGAALNAILDKKSKEGEDVKYLSVEEALKQESVYKAKSNREVTRVLFISRDESLLNPDKQSLDGYTDISDLFDEVHILILRQGSEVRNPVLRVADNVWLYVSSSRDWWWMPVEGMKLARAQLAFAGEFRPDMIVARDPFESAILAVLLGKRYNRPVQIHVLEDFTKSEFLKKNSQNRWRKYIPKFTLSRASSIRTSTGLINEVITKHFKVKDIATLPRFNNYESLISVPPTIDLKEKYKPFVFTIVYIGSLTFKSKLFRAIDAARFGLKNPHIGLIVLGSGPARKEFEKRAEVFGVKEQVIFESNVKDVVPYLKSANVLIVPDTDAESEEVALRGAAAGIPMVLARTPAREDIFMDGESALLCEPDNTDEFSLKLNMLMNDIPLRKHMVQSAQDMISLKFHEDPVAYLNAYRESVEQVLFVDDDKGDKNE